MRNIVKAFITGLLITMTLAAGWAFVHFYTHPVRVAVPQAGMARHKLLQDFGREIAHETRWLSFRRVAVADLTQAAQAIEKGEADVAVVRTDIAMPSNGLTLAILRQDPVLLLLPSNSSIENFRGLAGNAVGVVADSAEAEKVLLKVLNFYGLSEASVRRIPVEPEEAGAAVKQKKVAAIFVIGSPGQGLAADVYSSIAKATRATPEVLGVDEAEAIAKRFPSFNTLEVVEGAFGGSKPQPEEELTTLAVTYRLVVPASMSNLLAGNLAEVLFAAKSRLIAKNGSVAALQAPDDEDKSFRVHPGAKAYFDGEQQSFFDQFESVFWIGSAFVGVLGSLLSWGMSRLRKPSAGSDLERLVLFLPEVRNADAQGLMKLQDELDAIVANLMEASLAGSLAAEEVGVYSVGIENARHAVDERRAQLGRTA